MVQEPIWSPGDCLICRRKVVDRGAMAEGEAVRCPACGRYDVIEPLLVVQLRDSACFADKRHLLSGIARRATERGQKVRFTSEIIDLLLASPNVPRTPIEKMDALLAGIAHKSSRFGHEVTLLDGNDYPLAFAINVEESRDLVSALRREKLVDADRAGRVGWKVALTLAGWRRVEEMSKTGARSDQAFVAMWADPSMKDVWEKGIYPALDEMGYKPLCENWSDHSDKIDDKIIGDIRQSGLVVVDLTRHRPSVYYEAGFAHGLVGNVIFTCRESEADDTHFDIRQYKQIRWKDAADLKQKLVNRIRAMGLDRPKKKE